ncbi:MAG: lipid asymmetry maintenance protein MlaB [Hydrogenophaga sp.]|jgi:phospholipid transport system transporter-binding protein|nr:STAS domain-containing protein [Hydrogenophaga sp.]
MSQTPTAALPEVVTVHTVTAVLASLASRLRQQGAGEATLDAAALRTFDSSAVALLLELRRDLDQQGCRLRLVNLPDKLQELVALYGVGELLPA